MQAGGPGEAAALRVSSGCASRRGAGGVVAEAGHRDAVPQVPNYGGEPCVDRGIPRLETRRGRGLPDLERAAGGCLLNTGAGVDVGEERLR